MKILGFNKTLNINMSENQDCMARRGLDLGTMIISKLYVIDKVSFINEMKNGNSVYAENGFFDRQNMFERRVQAETGRCKYS
jgi:hypothetical protein